MEGRICLRSRKDVTLIEGMAVDFAEKANKAFFAGGHYFMQMEDSPEDDLFVARRKYRGKWNLYKPNDGAHRECSSAYIFSIDLPWGTAACIRRYSALLCHAN